MKKISLIFTLIFALSCTNNENTSSEDSQNQNNSVAEKPATIEVSIPLVKAKIGDNIALSINEKDTLAFDSVVVFANKKRIASFLENTATINWNSKAAKVGNFFFTVESYHKGKKTIASKSIELLSDIVPEKYTFKIHKTYQHDSKAYTQGLFWHNGFMYEGTGLKGYSTLRKVDLKTGAILQNYTIQEDYFGEGITLYNNKIIQLTWRSNVGFVYDLNTFELLDKFNYPREGWGITTLGDSLVMSDGTATLYFLSTQNYSELSRIEVYDDQGAVPYLNELEFINNEIWANIYGEQQIVCIDPNTGKVLKRIDFSTILDKADDHRNIDVFNGIAYNSADKKIYVTGKNWPKIYEITVFKKQ